MRKRPVISTQKGRPLRPPGERAATAHPLTAVPPYGCGVPDAGKRSAQKEGNQRNTGVANAESAAARDRKRGAVQMRPCPRASLHPDFGRHFAAGINCQVSAALRRARRDAIVNPQAPSHTAPRTATLHARAGARQKAFFWNVHWDKPSSRLNPPMWDP